MPSIACQLGFRNEYGPSGNGTATTQRGKTVTKDKETKCSHHKGRGWPARYSLARVLDELGGEQSREWWFVLYSAGKVGYLQDSADAILCRVCRGPIFTHHLPLRFGEGSFVSKSGGTSTGIEGMCGTCLLAIERTTGRVGFPPAPRHRPGDKFVPKDGFTYSKGVRAEILGGCSSRISHPPC